MFLHVLILFSTLLLGDKLVVTSYVDFNGDVSDDRQLRFEQLQMDNLLESLGGPQDQKEMLRLEVLDMLETNRHGARNILCKKGQKPQKRFFTIKLVLEETMSCACGDCPRNFTACFNENCGVGNGVKRLAYFMNGNLLNSYIEVCQYDTVVVDVFTAASESIVHWHGIRQWKTPFMDGATYITQCKSRSSAKYRYEFVATDIGTHMFYSAMDFHCLEGILGSLIVRSADDPWGFLQDTKDHVIMFQEWQKDLAVVEVLNSTDPELVPEAIIVNGRGADCKETVSSDGSKRLSCTDFPLAEVRVKKGKHQRLRLLDGTSLACPIQFQIDGHEMMVIAADGSPVEPIKGINTIVMVPGERYDVVISPNQKVGAYWIHLKGLGICQPLKIYQRALLIYEGAESKVPRHRNPGYGGYKHGLVLNPLTEHCLGMLSDMNDRKYISRHSSSSNSEEHDWSKGICAYQLRKLRNFNPHWHSGSDGTDYSSSELRQKKHNHVEIHLKFKIETYFNNRGENTLRAHFNNISLAIPERLVYGKVNFNNAFPKFKCRRDGTKEACLNIIKIKSGDTVIVILDHQDLYDPTPNAFHLHGYKFELLYQGHSLRDARDPRKYCEHPSLRDNIAVPAGGVAAIRFHANNQGLWLLQSVRELVLSAGLGVILQVGETKEFPPFPGNLPKC